MRSAAPGTLWPVHTYMYILIIRLGLIHILSVANLYNTNVLAPLTNTDVHKSVLKQLARRRKMKYNHCLYELLVNNK